MSRILSRLHLTLEDAQEGQPSGLFTAAITSGLASREPEPIKTIGDPARKQLDLELPAKPWDPGDGS